MIHQAPPDVGGLWKSIAPGHGGLEFVHIDANGNQTNKKVSFEIASVMLPEGWDLTNINGRWEGYRPVARKTKNVLRMNGDIYKYEVKDRAGDAFEFYFRNENSEWEILRNESRRASLRWWLVHECLL